MTREHKRGTFGWLIVELMVVIVYKMGSVIGHALAEILMGRIP